MFEHPFAQRALRSGATHQGVGGGAPSNQAVGGAPMPAPLINPGRAPGIAGTPTNAVQTAKRLRRHSHKLLRLLLRTRCRVRCGCASTSAPPSPTLIRADAKPRWLLLHLPTCTVRTWPQYDMGCAVQSPALGWCPKARHRLLNCVKQWDDPKASVYMTIPEEMCCAADTGAINIRCVGVGVCWEGEL